MTTYLILIGIAALSSLAYVALLYGSVPGIVEERFGEIRLPDFDVWQRDDGSDAGRAAERDGLYREVRYLPKSSGLLGARVIRQARYRSLSTGRIERVEPDEVLRIRRSKQRA